MYCWNSGFFSQSNTMLCFLGKTTETSFWIEKNWDLRLASLVEACEALCYNFYLFEFITLFYVLREWEKDESEIMFKYDQKYKWSHAPTLIYNLM